MATTKARRMRDLLKQGIVVSPGIFDGYSARLAEKMGFKACSTTGAGLANSRMSQPDVGIMTLTENAEACSRFANSISIPVMADADTGYGNAVTVYHTVQYFEQAGVVGINIEDQVSPKRCGHMRGKAIIDAREMAKKIEAAVKAKKDPDFIVNARTDAIAVEGIEGAIKRAKMYAAADIPTIDESGLPGFELQQFYSLVAPAGTPAEVVQRLNQEMVQRLPTADVKQRLAHEGIEVRTSTPAELGSLTAEQFAKWSRVIRQAGIKVH